MRADTSLRLLIAFITLLGAGTALAVDGVLEISQACAVNTGCFPGDAADFPVTITASGSYILTSNLAVSDPASNAVEMVGDDVSLDLNGFKITGPATCSGSPPAISCSGGSGLGIAGSGMGASVRGGAVGGFAAGGIVLGDDASVADLRTAANGGDGLTLGLIATVTNVRATDNAGAGIITGADGSVTSSTAAFNNGFGLDLGLGTGFSSNVVNQNGGGATTGGVRLNDNVCDGAECSCVPTLEVCDGFDNDCNGQIDDGFLNGGVYDQDVACGNCITDCTQILDLPNAFGTCDSSGVPTCVLGCDPGTSDLNGILLDGCEFAPDPDAIYVSASTGVDDGTCGDDPGSPCLTVAWGLQRAAAAMRARVLVGAGAYFEDVTLSDGIDLLGGYHPVTWARDMAANATALYGSAGPGHRAVVTVTGIVAATTFQGFVIHAASPSSAGDNSYGIYVSNSVGGLSLLDNTIFAGSGAAGLVGNAGGVGAAGNNGNAGADAFVTSSTPCSSANDRQLLNGGFRSCGGDNVAGGNGGGNVCAPAPDTESSGTDGFAGQSGSGSGGAGGGGGDAGDDGEIDFVSSSCVFFQPTSSHSGVAGLDGGPGGDGASGAGCSVAVGDVNGGHWIGGSGSFGAPGANGGGGGGGGAGGGAVCSSGSCCVGDILGAHGGGGGAGGCGGSGGLFGSGGGGSFGIFIVGGAAPTVQNQLIYRGTGGPGGAGGLSAFGGAGGAGGPGGASVFGGGASGSGGSGGPGGSGGGGGGGCGGGAYGILASGVSGTPDYCDPANANSITGGAAGTGGAGGAAPGNAGGNGAAGPLVDCELR